jgi:hypothetical protein
MQNYNKCLSTVSLLLPFLLILLNSFTYSPGASKYFGASADIFYDSLISTNYVDTVERESFISIPVINESRIREVI